MLSPYAELHCLSNFSFLKGASQPEELVERAAHQGYKALAITDECSLAGVVRAHLQAKTTGLHMIIGAQFSLHELWPEHAPRLVLLACNRNGYGNLSELITRARMRAEKGSYRLLREDLFGVDDCVALLVPHPRASVESICEHALFLRERWSALWIAVELLTQGHDQVLLDNLRAAASQTGIALVAAGDVQFHVRSRKSLQDTLTAIRLNRTVRELGFEVAPNAEQHLRSRLRLAQRYSADLLAATVTIASLCTFSLDELRYEYPEEIVPSGETPTSWLRKLTYEGVKLRYPMSLCQSSSATDPSSSPESNELPDPSSLLDPGSSPDSSSLPEPVRAQIEHELKLIAELRYEPYFLTVADIVAFARSQNILCQGRGSAANSAVCYCLGITEVDPARMSVLFERFISKERNEPPDIDVDFEHQRREEVMQYIYNKYGRDRAALTGVVISYRPRSAMRDVGKALGIDAQRLEQLSKSHQWWDGRHMSAEKLTAQGFDAQSLVVQHWISMTNTLMGFPRHLSQHTGGFVIARDRLSRLVPIENASMENRSVIEWDKDDLDALGLLKVDILALGMLSAIRRALDLIGARRGRPFRMQDVPAEDRATYDMICCADTVGVFQIESRAQMSMLPRLRPRKFYDLVIEVAIVRPGPIQGGMVHPYLRRRQGLESVDYPREEIKPALARTLGVPIFQEQVMQVAILAAGFTPGEADALRRAMAAWKRKGGLGGFYERVLSGMLERGYQRDFAERIFKQIEGFGEYGFPESHAASFALLVYVSCWIKCHEPAAFLAAMLNSQPLGFYAPAQLVRDARAHGVAVLPVDVLLSQYECTLDEGVVEEGSSDERASDKGTLDRCTPSHCLGAIQHRQPAVRLGLNQIRGLNADAARRLILVREQQLELRRQNTAPPENENENENEVFAFDSIEDLARCVRLDQSSLHALARSGALQVLGGHRAHANWEVAAIKPLPALLDDVRFEEAPIQLQPLSEGEEIIADYGSIGIPMGRHPLALLRPKLARFGIQPAEVLNTYPNARLARACGIVTHRQRPETAKGTLFVTLEDETGAVNVIVWPALVETYRKEVLSARLMTVYGVWQRDAVSGGVTHLVARRIVDHTEFLGELSTRSRDFH